MSADRGTALVHGLATLVGENADWLDGRTFIDACVRVAEGYFADVPTMVAADEFAEVLREALADGTSLDQIH